MGAWWRRNPFYGWYMLRELSCVFVTAYAGELLWGLARLTQGREAWEAWRAGLASAPALLFHAAALVLVGYHAWTWFKVMPKTLPFIAIGGRRVGDRTIVASGVVAALAATVLVFAAVAMVSQ
jgi:fumarate reductase subunit C